MTREEAHIWLDAHYSVSYQEDPEWVDEMLDWLESVDVPLEVALPLTVHALAALNGEE